MEIDKTLVRWASTDLGMIFPVRWHRINLSNLIEAGKGWSVALAIVNSFHGQLEVALRSVAATIRKEVPCAPANSPIFSSTRAVLRRPFSRRHHRNPTYIDYYQLNLWWSPAIPKLRVLFQGCNCGGSWRTVQSRMEGQLDVQHQSCVWSLKSKTNLPNPPASCLWKHSAIMVSQRISPSPNKPDVQLT